MLADCVKNQKWQKATEYVLKFNVPKDEFMYSGYEKLGVFAINSEDETLISNAREIFYQMEQAKPSFTSKSAKLLEILHLLKQRNDAQTSAQLGKVAAKCATALLRHLDVYDMDRAFFIAGKLNKVFISNS